MISDKTGPSILQMLFPVLLKLVGKDSDSKENENHVDVTRMNTHSRQGQCDISYRENCCYHNTAFAKSSFHKERKLVNWMYVISLFQCKESGGWFIFSLSFQCYEWHIKMISEEKLSQVWQKTTKYWYKIFLLKYIIRYGP